MAARSPKSAALAAEFDAFLGQLEATVMKARRDNALLVGFGEKIQALWTKTQGMLRDNLLNQSPPVAGDDGGA